MCLDTAPDKAFENVFCIEAILRLAIKNRFCESSQRLINRVQYDGPDYDPTFIADR
jgi:hypothetical protein